MGLVCLGAVDIGSFEHEAFSASIVIPLLQTLEGCMAVCSRKECVRTVVFVLYETLQAIYTPAVQASCRLRDDGCGGVSLGTYLLRPSDCHVAIEASGGNAHKVF
jgi:hypothetical protein